MRSRLRRGTGPGCAGVGAQLPERKEEDIREEAEAAKVKKEKAE
ncbi:hypothetical protein [Streptomyces sp. NPDC052107]